MDANLEKEHLRLKTQYTMASNQTSTVLLLSQALQDQANVSAALMRHAEVLAAELKRYDACENSKPAKPETPKNPVSDGGSVPGTPPAPAR